MWQHNHNFYMQYLLKLALIMSFVSAIACSPTSILNTISGASSMRTAKDISYASQARQKLDRYAASNPSCLVIFIYGGNWREGSKEEYGFVGAQLAKRGYAVSIPDYRLYPEVTFPAFVTDIAAAVAFELEQPANKDLPLVLMGHSAGALVAALLSLDGRYLGEEGLHKSRISALVSLAGPHDYFLPTDKPKWTAIFGEDKTKQKQALPINHASDSAPPTLILHGADDDIVTPKSAHSLYSSLIDRGVTTTLEVYPNVGHKRLVAAIGAPLHFLAPTLEDIDQFLKAIGCQKP